MAQSVNERANILTHTPQHTQCTFISRSWSQGTGPGFGLYLETEHPRPQAAASCKSYPCSAPEMQQRTGQPGFSTPTDLSGARQSRRQTRTALRVERVNSLLFLIPLPSGTTLIWGPFQVNPSFKFLLPLWKSWVGSHEMAQWPRKQCE